MYNEKLRRESIQYGIFPKKNVLNHLKSLKGWWSSSLNQIDILITILFRMLFFFFSFFPKNHHHDLRFMFFAWAPKFFFWGRHLLNKNNNHALEVHGIIFLFKMYMIFVMIRIDTTWIIMKYLKCLTYCSCLTYYSWSNYAQCFQKHRNLVNVSTIILIEALDMFIFHMSTKVNSLGRYLS